MLSLRRSWRWCLDIFTVFFSVSKVKILSPGKQKFDILEDAYNSTGHTTRPCGLLKCS